MFYRSIKTVARAGCPVVRTLAYFTAVRRFYSRRCCGVVPARCVTDLSSWCVVKTSMRSRRLRMSLFCERLRRMLNASLAWTSLSCVMYSFHAPSLHVRLAVQALI